MSITNNKNYELLYMVFYKRLSVNVHSGPRTLFELDMKKQNQLTIFGYSHEFTQEMLFDSTVTVICSLEPFQDVNKSVLLDELKKSKGTGGIHLRDKS